MSASGGRGGTQKGGCALVADDAHRIAEGSRVWRGRDESSPWEHKHEWGRNEACSTPHRLLHQHTNPGNRRAFRRSSARTSRMKKMKGSSRPPLSHAPSTLSIIECIDQMKPCDATRPQSDRALHKESGTLDERCSHGAQLSTSTTRHQQLGLRNRAYLRARLVRTGYSSCCSLNGQGIGSAGLRHGETNTSCPY